VLCTIYHEDGISWSKLFKIASFMDDPLVCMKIFLGILLLYLITVVNQVESWTIESLKVIDFLIDYWPLSFNGLLELRNILKRICWRMRESVRICVCVCVYMCVCVCEVERVRERERREAKVREKCVCVSVCCSPSADSNTCSVYKPKSKQRVHAVNTCAHKNQNKRLAK